MNSPNVVLATVQYMLYQSEKQKYDTVGTIPKSNIKIMERGKIDTLTHKYMTSNTQIHDLSLA
jgi:hypothetical protein